MNGHLLYEANNVLSAAEPAMIYYGVLLPLAERSRSETRPKKSRSTDFIHILKTNPSCKRLSGHESLERERKENLMVKETKIDLWK